MNDELEGAAQDLLEAGGTNDSVATQRSVQSGYARILGVGEEHLKGPDAGLVWLNFPHLPEDTPPQVVGRPRHRTPQKKGNVYYQNVIRENLDRKGGEAVFVEMPDSLSALSRRSDGNTEQVALAHF